MNRIDIFTPHLEGACIPVNGQLHGLFRVVRSTSTQPLSERNGPRKAPARVFPRRPTANKRRLSMFTWVFVLAAALLPTPSVAQNPDDPAIEVCRTTGLMALRERSPSLKNLIFDMELLTVSKANTTIEDIPVRTVIMGEAYLERKETDKSQRFVCLIGEKGKVLLTFFTAQ